MSEQDEIKLSSNWANFGLYFGAFISLAFIPIFYLVITSQPYHIGMVLGGIIYVALVGFVIYWFMFGASARIKGDKLIFKKQFSAPKVYGFDKIGDISSFRLKRGKFTTVKMENEDGSFDNYFIYNSFSLLSFENKDAEESLNALKRMSKMTQS